ncbi:MAG: hypothetical protein ACOY94_07895 [Bacillota bacterium]
MKRKINWAIPGLLAMLLIIGGIALAQSLAATSPDPAKLATQCSACHGMDEYVASWKTSSHKDVACTECHADHGVRGWLEMQLGQIRMVTAATRDPNFDIAKVATEVPSQRCLDCHSRQMPWVMQDLKPPKLDENGEPIRVAASELTHFKALAGHDLHLTLDNPLSCTECHATTSHGPAERPYQVRVWHNTCLECHAEEKVAMSVRTTISCSACHTDLDLVSPDDHKQADFRTVHGQSAAANVQSCQQCHLTPGLVKLNPGDQPPAAFFQTVSQERAHPTTPEMPPGSLKAVEGLKDACSACHGITMPHPESWLTNHTEGFRDRPELCASCHGTRDQGFDVKVVGNPRTLSTTDATCTNCHAQPMPHPENWVSDSHYTLARTAPQTCVQCHSSQNQANPTAPHAAPLFCLDCHLTKFTHPSEFLAQHGSIALAPNGRDISADCTTCHTETVNSCTECHTDGVGQGVKQQWHPTTWLATHSKVALTADGQIAASCTDCHTPTFNSCTACHTDGVGKGVEPQWHPDSWIADHRNVALASNGKDVAANCTSCHTETFNSCTECHTAGFGQGVKQQWHPPMFWVSHARTTKPETIASCKSCHNYVEPSCAKCHRDY